MNFICEKTKLLNSISIVSKAINQSTTVDLLKCIKLDVGEFIKLSASDMEISIESEIEADIKEEGSILLDARIFYDIIRSLPLDGENVEIYTSSMNEIKIECKNTVFNILYLPSVGYPETEHIKDGENIKIYSKNFKEIIKNTIFAISDDESKPILTGSFFEVQKSNLKVVSIDRFRLALRNQIIPQTDLDELNFVVPGKILNELLKILKDDSTIVDITVKDNSVMFKFDSFTITTRLLEGEFLDYNKFIPQNSTISAKINVKKFTEIIERAAVIINYDDPKIPVVLSLKNSSVCVECVSKYGNFSESVEIDKLGDDLLIGMDSRLILNALKCISDPYAVFEFSTPQSPCVIKPVEGDSFIYMVLPMRLKNQ